MSAELSVHTWRNKQLRKRKNWTFGEPDRYSTGTDLYHLQKIHVYCLTWINEYNNLERAVKVKAPVS
jgi:hypothetical protein